MGSNAHAAGARVGRIDWKGRRAEAQALVETGASLAEVATRFGCSEGTASAGLRRLALCIDPTARARRAALLSRVGADPGAIEKRTVRLKATLATPQARRHRARHARLQWQNEDVRARTIATLKEATSRMFLAARSARSAMAGVAKLAWCPSEYRAEYARLRRRLRSASEAKRLILDQIAHDYRQRYPGQTVEGVIRATAELVARFRRHHPARG